MRGRKKDYYVISGIAAQIGSAATAGFGLSLGRDFYRNVKSSSNSIAIFVAAMLAFSGPLLPIISGVWLVQGYRNRGVLAIVLNIALCMAAIAAGIFLMIFISAMFDDFLLKVNRTHFSGYVEDYTGWVTAVAGILTFLGMLIGLRRRRYRLQRFATIDHNEAFLAGNGFKETHGRDVTHYDPDGNPLRFLEASPNKLVFMAVGQRGRRAYINLDDNGSMQSYTGIV
jgi:hypothetical protein